MIDLPFPKSLPEFTRLFPDDAACARYLEGCRWPEGFRCPACGKGGDPFRFAARPGVLRCRACRKDTSLTAGTVMERTHSALSTWFWAAYLASTQTPGLSAVQFQRQLGIGRYETAFQILHKLRAGMVRPNAERIGGDGKAVELDETLVGGATRGEGKGTHHKIYVIGAVEVLQRPPVVAGKEPTKAMLRRAGTYAGRLRLRVADDRQGATLQAFVRETVAQGTTCRTDGWGGYDQIDLECGVKRHAVVEGGDPEVAEKHLPLIHLVFSNLKSWLLGTHHAAVSDQHLQAYCNEFVFRFNRRFYPFNGFRSLLGLGACAEAPTYAELYEGKWAHPVATGKWELTG
jgi:hypothetical protein